MDESAGEHQFVPIGILVIHVGGHIFIAFNLHFKFSADDVRRGNIVLNRRVCHNGSGGGAFRAADHIDREILFIEIFHHLHHGQIEAVNIAHIVKTVRLLLPEVHSIVIELLHRHSGVSLGEIPCQLFTGCITGPYLCCRRL